MERRTYHESALLVSSGPFGGDLRMAEGAICADGVRRNAYPSGGGIADTFFSIPAYVHVRSEGKQFRVYGYVTIESVEGFTCTTDEDPATVKFVAYTYRKHHALVGSGKFKSEQ